MKLKLKPVVAWYDLWLGAYWDRKTRTLYVLPLPCLGVSIQFIAKPYQCTQCAQWFPLEEMGFLWGDTQMDNIGWCCECQKKDPHGAATIEKRAVLRFDHSEFPPFTQKDEEERNKIIREYYANNPPKV